MDAYDTSRDNVKSDTVSWFVHSRPWIANLAALSAIATLILAAFWSNSNANGFLTIPDWQNNIFSWHPVLMTAGFFFSQVLAVIPFSVPFMQTDPLGGAFFAFWPLFWNSAALATLIAALYAVFKFRSLEKDAHLATIHEWTGILIAILFVLNYLMNLAFIIWGAVLAMTRDRNNEEQNRVRIKALNNFGSIHVFTSLTVLVLTAANIMSGLVQKQAVCITQLQRFTTWPTYNQLPEGCKISDGIGILVIVTTLLTLLVVMTGYNIKPRSGDEQERAQRQGEGGIQTQGRDGANGSSGQRVNVNQM